MDNDITKNKLKMQDIINEITLLKKYNNDLLSNSKGEKIEGYLNKLNKDITKAQDKVEIIYTKNFK